MIENSNKAIVLNSFILYSKLLINLFCSLYTTKFALLALGVSDFGLFSLLGSVISFIAIFNTIMISTSTRFISVAIGKGIKSEINEQFNICLLIHIVIAIFSLIFSIPLGDYYIYNYLNYDGNINEAINVYHITIVGSVISFIGVPYQGLLMAKEKFLVFSLTDIICHIIKLIIAFLLIYYFENKLILYAITISILTIAPLIVNWIYCKIYYLEYTYWKISKDLRRYKEIFYFSGWVAYGAVASIGKSQGAAIIVNNFFNTAMNAALGLANTVSALLITFSNSIAQPIAPQITKSYSSGNYKRCNELLIMSTKYTYLVTFIISIPFLCNPQYIFDLWLGHTPDYVVPFAILLIIDTLVQALNSGISNIIFASGKIKMYQVVINTLRFISIIAAYYTLKYGGPAYSLFIAYILFSIIIFFACQYILHKTLNYNNRILWKESYKPSLVITSLFLPSIFMNLDLHPILNIILLEIYFIILIYIFALSSNIKKMILNKILFFTK